ncbi:AfsR/SARP family transcriptional regulator [Streptomyces umbrinus]|uniref:AfsR/SARP family transcriptional regulator n=1 Tax=Streptomyces umbrinus TaxID=67370 RepID=UPI0033E9334D
MRFRVLGPVCLEPRTPSAPKQRAVLATLLVRAGAVVPAGALFDELWPDGPPRTAATTLQVYVSHLRKALTQGGHGRGPLETRPPGYLLRVEPGELDLRLFEELLSRGRAAFGACDFAAASRELTEALALWSGPALSGVPQGEVLTAAAVRLDELRFEALELRIEADLRLGRHHEVTGELMELARAHPLREQLHCQLMEALRRAGRTTDALRAYRAVHRSLHEELGVTPGPALMRLHARVLSSHASEPGSGAATAAAVVAAPIGRPRAGSRRASGGPLPDVRVSRAHRRSP